MKKQFKNILVTTMLILSMSILLVFIDAKDMSAKKPKWTGKKIMEKVDKSNRYDASRSIATMKIYRDLTKPNKGIRVRKTVRFVLNDYKKDEHYQLTYFVCPADVARTSALTYEKGNSDDIQYMFQPLFEDARDSARKIQTSEKSSYFMGTDYTYEDMEFPNIEDYNYKLLGKKKIKNELCYIVKAVKKNIKSTNYSKKIIWISTKKWMPIRIQLFDKKKKYFKTIEYKSIKRINGVYTPSKIVVYNKKTKSGTVSIISKTNYYKKGSKLINKKMFTPKQTTKIPRAFVKEFNKLKCK